MIHFQEEPGSDGGSVAVAALEQAGHGAICVSAPHLDTPDVFTTLVPALRREAVLQNAGIVVTAIDALGARAPTVIRELSGDPVPLIVAGKGAWDPAWSDTVPMTTVLPRPSVEERVELWRDVLPPSVSIDLREIAEQFALGPLRIRRAARAAHSASCLDGSELQPQHVLMGIRSQNSASLARWAHHTTPNATWPEIVLPQDRLRQLRELTARVRYRDRVLGDWQMNPAGGRGRGVTALFAGESGTGKTLAAEIVAADLGLDLFTVNLSARGDESVTDAEEVIERILTAADGMNTVLLFDEADAIVGKRADVRGDRVLQRIERFDGLAILTANGRTTLDDAITRRLDLVIDFPWPDEASRCSIWKRCLRDPAPCTGIDFDFCARTFPLSGGNIRSAAITAGYHAAAAGTAIQMDELLAAIQEEYRKLGRLAPDERPSRSRPVS